MLALILLADILLHIPCYLHFHRGRFSYTSYAGFFFVIWGVPLTHPVLAFSWRGGGGGSFSYTSHVAFIFIWGFSLTYPVLASFSYAGSFSYTSHAHFFFFFMWEVSLTHPLLPLFLSGEFLLHIPCWLYFSVGSFSYTSHARFFLFF